MGIISWLVVGAIAGILAGFFVSGDEGLGIIGRVLLGIIGAVVGGFIAGAITGGDYITGINITTFIVATIGAVDQTALAILDRLGAKGNDPEIEKSDGPRQARQARPQGTRMVQARGFQVEAVAFEVGEHLFDPHADTVMRTP